MADKPRNLSEAIEQLESPSQLAAEIKRLEEALQKLKPEFENLKAKASAQAEKAKQQVEDQVHKNPWATMGIVGLIFFIVGYLLGHRRRD